jgi:hypothetical protein
MDLVGAWLRQLLRAGTVAALVPIAIVASLAVVLAGTGGISGLDALGQLVTGPEISPAQRAVAATPGERGDTTRDVALVAPPALLADATAPAAPSGPGTGTAPPATGQTLRPPQRVVPLRPPVVRPPPGPVAPPPPAAAPPAAAPAAPPTPGQRTGKVVEELGETVDEVVGVVGEVIGGLGETLGGILDGPPPRR